MSNSLLDMIQQNRRQSAGIKGVAVAVVTNNEDKDDLARIKVKYPWRHDEDESFPARILAPMAGNGMGVYFLPEVGDEVLVGFENGEIDHPIVLGSLWSKTMPPPETNADKKNNRRLIKSRSGHFLIFDDKAGEEKIEIIDKTGKNLVTIESKDNKITIKSEGDIHIEAKQKISLKAKEITMETDKDISAEAGGKIALKASGDFKAEGSNAEVKAQGMGKFESGGNLDLKAGGNNTVKGAIVMIN